MTLFAFAPLPGPEQAEPLHILHIGRGGGGLQPCPAEGRIHLSAGEGQAACQALGDEAVIRPPFRRREVRGGPPAEGDQNHIRPGGRVEVLPAEVIEDLDVKPGPEQQGGPALPGQAAEALGRPLLHEQIHMAGQIGACGELTDDGAGQGEGDVGKDLVGPFGQGSAEKIPPGQAARCRAASPPGSGRGRGRSRR